MLDINIEMLEWNMYMCDFTDFSPKADFTCCGECSDNSNSSAVCPLSCLYFLALSDLYSIAQVDENPLNIHYKYRHSALWFVLTCR